MDPKIQELRARLEELTDTNRALIAKADQDGRELTDEESEQIDANSAEFEHITGEIQRRERVLSQMDTLAEPQPRKTATAPVAKSDDGVKGTVSPRISGGDPNRPRKDYSGRNGFRSMGEFLASAVNAGQGRQPDNRLYGAATDHREAVGDEGGFLLPPEFRQAILTQVFGEESLIGRTDGLTSSSNSMVVPIDEDEPWSGNGITAFWEGEAQQTASSKQPIKQEQVRLNKLTALVYLTDELIEDAPAMEAFIRRKAPEKIDHKLNMGIVHGDGVGKPLGFLNSGALITQAAEGGQTADTLNYQNVQKMYSRMQPNLRSGAIWLLNPELEPQLYNMAFRESATDPVPVYLPANGASGSPYGTLFGRPVVPSQVMNPLGDAGDIAFVNLAQYLTLTKSGGLRTDSSIHVRFDENVTAFRFVMRVGGMPWHTKPINPRTGSYTQSPFITLAAR